MSLALPSSNSLVCLALAALLFGCEEKAEKEAASAKPSAAAAAPTPTPTPTPPPPPKPREDCPEGSSGIGTSAEPCKGSGDARMMDVTYVKTDDQGPKFKIVNKTKKKILYGSVAAYFYDKAGKQLQVTQGGKPRPMQICSGNIFAGAVNPEETLFMYFSCVKKDHVPEGTKTIEAEMKSVGFADAAGTANEFYWANMDLVPDERPKGGLKSKTAKKK